MTPENALRARLIEIARSTEGLSGPQPWAAEAGWMIAPSDRPEWCALWYLAMLRRLGLKMPDWKMGQSVITDCLTRIGARQSPRPGDLGLVKRGWHHAMVVKEENGIITSIDGNGPGGVVVVDRMRPRTEYTAFYSIRKHLQDWTPYD